MTTRVGQVRFTRQGLMIVVAWLFLLAAMIGVWSAPFISGKLPDTDDYMRMERTFALLDGEDMPSYAAPGLGIDGKAETGWSYLVDAPVVMVQGTLELLGFERIPAAMLTATIVPLLALLALLAAAVWYARPLI